MFQQGLAVEQVIDLGEFFGVPAARAAIDVNDRWVRMIEAAGEPTAHVSGTPVEEPIRLALQMLAALDDLEPGPAIGASRQTHSEALARGTAIALDAYCVVAVAHGSAHTPTRSDLYCELAMRFSPWSGDPFTAVESLFEWRVGRDSGLRLARTALIDMLAATGRPEDSLRFLRTATRSLAAITLAGAVSMQVGEHEGHTGGELARAATREVAAKVEARSGQATSSSLSEWLTSAFELAHYGSPGAEAADDAAGNEIEHGFALLDSRQDLVSMAGAVCFALDCLGSDLPGRASGGSRSALKRASQVAVGRAGRLSRHGMVRSVRMREAWDHLLLQVSLANRYSWEAARGDESALDILEESLVDALTTALVGIAEIDRRRQQPQLSSSASRPSS